MTKDYEGFSKEELINWIELCHDLLTQKGVTDNNHGALYSIYGRFGLYVDYNEARIAALESRLREAEKLGAVAESVNLWLKRSNMGGTAHQRELESALAAFLAGGDTNKV